MSSGTHILVVDDHALNRKLVASLLEHEGYRVSEAADGAEGLSVALRDVPELVISDILMPSMDGYEFVRRLRADPVTATVRVIFYTANYHEREAQSLAEKCGVSRVIVKPCRAPVLLQAVAGVLAGGKVEPPATAAESSFDMEHLRLLTDKLSQNADALRATNSRLAALTELNLHMASEHDPRRLLQSVCSRARDLIGARFAILAVIDKQHTTGLITCTSGLPVEQLSGIRDPREDPGVLGKVFAERIGQSIISKAGAPLDLGLPAQFPQVRVAIAAPVCSLTRPHGWLCLCEKVGAEQFSTEDERLLTILSAQLGRIYENGSLYCEVQEQASKLVIEMDERARATDQLRTSEERFRELAENIHDVFFVAGPDLTLTHYISPGFERVWGRPVASMLNRPDSWLEAVDPADRDRVQAEMEQIRLAYPAAGQLEYRILRPDETVRWVHTRIFPIMGNGEVLRTVGVSSDITARKLAELRVMRLNRTHAVLSGINSLIVRATERDSLLEDACRLAVREGGFRLAWCGLLDPKSRELRTNTFAGEGGEVVATMHATIDADTADKSLIAEAVLSGKPRICNDLGSDGARSLYRREFLALGCQSFVVLPFMVGGEARGCLVLLADAPDYFDEEEMRLLVELADDISFALDHIGKAERLDYLASYDPLTGLQNRREFEQCLAAYVSLAETNHSRFAVVVADPERFEAVNSMLGRAVGDEVLRQAGLRFAEAAGGRNVTGHIDSDKFAAIMTGSVDGSGISRLINELWIRWLGAPFVFDGQSIELTAKAGVAFYPADGTTADELLTNATAALRNAKESGKAVGFYARHLSERIAERLTLERELRRALDNGEYELHYQPKVDAVQRRIKGVEALLRWRRPERGLVMPAAFVPILEETGMIVEVGAWVMQQACMDRQRWAERGLTSPRVAVNVSAVQIHRNDFAHTIGRALQRAGPEAGLDIEVTESMLMDDVEDNLIRLEAVREFGVGIALDDFGVGYSSLAYLAKLPISVLKIDRSFVESMLEDTSVMTLVSTVISLARSLKLETVAEGVETEEQARILRLLGCDQLQGYLISKPLPFEEIAPLLANGRG